MGLKNFQYNKIIRQYDATQLYHKRILDEHYKIIYDAIPEIKTIDEEIASQSAAYGKAAVLNNDDSALEELCRINRRLNQKKTDLLITNGYPFDYLTLSYTCKDCKDTGYIDHSVWHEDKSLRLSQNKCHCFKQAIVDLLYAQSNVKKAIAKENFSTFSYDYYDNDYVDATIGISPYNNMRSIVTTCKAFIENFDTSFQNILFYGNAGVGKTFLTNCIAKELLDTAHTVIYLTSFQLFEILEKHKFSKTSENYETEEQFQGILDCDLLIIDDLGTEMNNTFVTSQLYLCINERQLSQRSTIISTNLSLDDLSTHYSERIFSRITSNYTILKLVGDDIRLKKAFTP